MNKNSKITPIKTENKPKTTIDNTTKQETSPTTTTTDTSNNTKQQNNIELLNPMSGYVQHTSLLHPNADPNQKYSTSYGNSRKQAKQKPQSRTQANASTF